MSNITVDQIREQFDRMGCPAVIILKTSNAGDSVDNGCGMDFDLPEWAVIHDNKMVEEVYDWQNANGVDLFKFQSDQCSTVDSLARELHERDGYEIQWRRDGT